MLPKVIKCTELPQWIICSDRAAYNPHSNTIYIRKDEGILTLLHEYCHWLFCKLNWKFGHVLIDGKDLFI